MKKLTMYQCEVCEGLFETPEEATDCESQGVEDPLAQIGEELEVSYPVEGYGVHRELVRVKGIERYGHFLVYNFEYKIHEGWENHFLQIWSNDEFRQRCRRSSYEWRVD